MGKLEEFSIHLSHPDAVFEPGGLLTGHAVVELNERMKTRGIDVSFKGRARLDIMDKASESMLTEKETFFDEQYSLYAAGEEGVDIYLEKGRHKFDFELRLQPYLPSSFESEHGHVRYWVGCEINKPWKFSHTVKEAFSVLSMLDLNLEKNIESPFHDEARKEDACCFCYDNGDVSICLDLPRTGYVPGESIPVTAEIKNNTSGFVRTSVNLVQKITYMPKDSTPKPKKEIVNNLPDLELEPHSKYVFNRESLLVPAVAPSRLDGCSLIALAYQLKIKASTDFSGVSCKVAADLTIGTVPLKSQVVKFSDVKLEPSVPLATEEREILSVPSASLDFDFPPPSYQCCVFGLVDIRDEGDNEFTRGAPTFAPKYAFYKSS